MRMTRLALPILILTAMLFCSCLEPVSEAEIGNELPPDGKTYDLNKVTTAELMSIKEIHKKEAIAIIQYRKDFGFRRVEDLINVSGIGEKTFMKIRHHFRIEPQGEAP